MGIDYKATEKYPKLTIGQECMVKRGHLRDGVTRLAIVLERNSGRIHIKFTDNNADWWLETDDEVSDIKLAIHELIRMFLLNPQSESIKQELIKAVKGAIDVFDKNNSVRPHATPSRELPKEVHRSTGRVVEEALPSGRKITIRYGSD